MTTTEKEEKKRLLVGKTNHKEAKVEAAKAGKTIDEFITLLLKEYKSKK